MGDRKKVAVLRSETFPEEGCLEQSPKKGKENPTGRMQTFLDKKIWQIRILL